MTATATILGPVLALFTIIGAMGNGPLAAVLWENEVMFAGIIGFLYADYVIEHGRPRLAHVNVKANPTANWTLQQLREVVGDLHVHPYLIHDRDRIFAKHLDDSIRALGLEVLKSPVASPEANAICERVIGTIRRECLDWPIPVWEPHLRAILKEWVAHYNGGRCHGALGPGVPDPPRGLVLAPKSEPRHRLAAGALVLAKSILGGLHHELDHLGELLVGLEPLPLLRTAHLAQNHSTATRRVRRNLS